jgi:hypothetical protein
MVVLKGFALRLKNPITKQNKKSNDLFFALIEN